MIPNRENGAFSMNNLHGPWSRRKVALTWYSVNKLKDFPVPITFYHNPRCSKSRAALSLLEERQLDIEIIEYLKTPPNSSTLHKILEKLGGSAAQLVRTSEKEYQTLNLAQADKYRLIDAIVEHPNLMQRPIIVSNDRAVIGRPPEQALTIL
jgi:arsenate reductase